MKKIHYLMAAVCAIALLATGCKGKNDPTQKEFLFNAQLANNDTTVSELEWEVAYLLFSTAIQAAGYDENAEQFITGDSATVMRLALSKQETIVALLGDAFSEYNFTFSQRACSKEESQKKRRTWTRWTAHQFGQQSDDDTRCYMSVRASEQGLYATDIRVIDWGKSYFTAPRNWDDYRVLWRGDLNSAAGGHYMYTAIELKKWSSSYSFITNVIAVYSDHEKDLSFTMNIDGRRYQMASSREGSYDLNKGAGGPYIYLMYTTDDYDGRYLCSLRCAGDDEDEKISCCYIICPINNYSAAKDIENGRFKDVRPVMGYNLKGECEGEADFNKGAGGAYVRMILYYAPKP